MPATGKCEPTIRAAVETAPRERLLELQLERLRATVARVLDAPTLLAARLREAGVESAADVRSLDDLGGCRSPKSATCASTTRSGCWRGRGSAPPACTRRAGTAANRPPP